MNEKHIKEMTDLLLRRESNKAKMLIENIFMKASHRGYATAYTAVLLSEVRKRLCQELSGFYIEEDRILEKLFPKEGAPCFENVIDRLSEAVKNSEKENKKRVFLKAVAYIDENLTDCSLSVGDAAEYAGVSPAMLSKIFSAFKGITPVQYIAQKRVERSLDKLKKQGASVSDIALESGFSSAEAYIRVFRKHYEVPPGRWNKLFLSKNGHI